MIDADELGRQFWDNNDNLKSIDEIKYLVKKGANLGIEKNAFTSVWKVLSIDEMDDVLKDLPKGYVINGEVVLNGRGFDRLPDFSKVVVRNYFGCNNNNLVSLKGCPYKVLGDFGCLGNKLTSLDGGPQEVSGNFICSENKLTSLNGAPKKVGGIFICHKNKLVTLDGAPLEVGGDFSCRYNSKLENFNGKSKVIGGVFLADSDVIKRINNSLNGNNIMCEER